VQYLIDSYRRRTGPGYGSLTTVGLGDSLNDLPMLETVDRPILVQLTDGSYEPGIELPRLSRAPGPGPVGWKTAVRALLQ
jgi:mannosyl-3-phosphoglycerate phosphatase